jgi:nicotinate-nucleotide adenylyltransferase
MIAILGGSFDPIHNGHLAVAQKILETFEPNKIRFIPCAQHAFEKSMQVTASDRLNMIRLALISQASEFCIDDQEIKVGGVSYTIDTLRRIRTQLSSDESLALIIGQDALLQLDKWKEWSHLLAYAHIIVVSRNTKYPINTELLNYIEAHKTDDIKLIKSKTSGYIYFLDMPLVDISSTAVREGLVANQLSKEMLPKKVLEYIKNKGLYSRSM